MFCWQVNDFMRDKFTMKDNTIPFAAEILAGGCVSVNTLSGGAWDERLEFHSKCCGFLVLL